MTKRRSRNALKLLHHRDQLAAAVKSFQRLARRIRDEYQGHQDLSFSHVLTEAAYHGRVMLTEIDSAIALEDEATV